MTNTTFSIKHRIELEAKPSDLYRALSDRDGLAAWWTPMVETDSSSGSTAQFRFGDGKHGPDMRIDELSPHKVVAWHCVEGPWKGMDFRFDIQEHERGAALNFSNTGWPEQSEFYMHCNAKWGFFLAVSLKRYLETGTGVPHPDDPKI